jgi:membrane-bound serine protease (ClpP class)
VSYVFLVVAFVLLLLLPSPWNLVGFGIALVLFVGELGFWNRRVRGTPTQAGAETLIGRTGTVVAECRPTGQVRLDGEIWEARCKEGAERGDTVVVTERDGLTLDVARSPAPE